MQEELQELGQRMRCWEITPELSPEQIKQMKPLRHKWVFKRKWDEGKPALWRARLTVKGCAQTQGVNFTDTFSPVAELAVCVFFLL